MAAAAARTAAVAIVHPVVVGMLLLQSWRLWLHLWLMSPLFVMLLRRGLLLLGLQHPPWPCDDFDAPVIHHAKAWVALGRLKLNCLQHQGHTYAM